MDFNELNSPSLDSDVINTNFRRIEERIQRIDIVNSLPAPAAKYYGQDLIVYDDVAGDVPCIGLKTFAGNYTWSPYIGDVYDGVTGPLIFPVNQFKTLGDTVEEDDLGVLDDNFDKVWAEYQKRNLSANLPAPAAYLRGWKWYHDTPDGTKFVICCLDASGTYYWKGPMSYVDYTVPVQPGDYPITGDPSGDPRIVIDRFEPSDVGVWNSNAEGNVACVADGNVLVEGDSSMRVSKCIALDDFDGTGGESDWAIDTNGGFQVEDGTTKVEGDYALKVFPQVPSGFYEQVAGAVQCSGGNAFAGMFDQTLSDTINSITSYFSLYNGYPSVNTHLYIYEQSSDISSLPSGTHWADLPMTLVATSNNTQTINATTNPVSNDKFLYQNPHQVYTFDAFEPDPDKLYSIVIGASGAWGGYFSTFVSDQELTLMFVFSGGVCETSITATGINETMFLYNYEWDRNLDDMVISQTFDAAFDLSGQSLHNIQIKSTFSDVDVTLTVTDNIAGTASKTWNIQTQDFTEMTWDISAIPDNNKTQMASATLTVHFNDEPAADEYIWFDIWEVCPGTSEDNHKVLREYTNEYDLTDYTTIYVPVKGTAGTVAQIGLRLDGINITYFDLTTTGPFTFNTIDISSIDDKANLDYIELIPPTGETEFETHYVDIIYAV